MKSLPDYPDATAAILDPDIVQRGWNAQRAVYEQIKVLTEAGKQYGNVELKFHNIEGTDVYSHDEYKAEDVRGRTIHADGTVIPFTGKPFVKTLERSQGRTYQA